MAVVAADIVAAIAMATEIRITARIRTALRATTTCLRR